MAQPQDITASVKKKVEVEEEVGLTLRELSLAAGTPTTAAAMSVVLAPLDDVGEWRTDIAPVLVQFRDKMDSQNPMERYEASMFLQLMFTATVADTPTHQALGVAGLSVWDAAKVIAPAKLAAILNPQEPGE